VAIFIRLSLALWDRRDKESRRADPSLHRRVADRTAATGWTARRHCCTRPAGCGSAGRTDDSAHQTLKPNERNQIEGLTHGTRAGVPRQDCPADPW
jgi:hypothetical protein